MNLIQPLIFLFSYNLATSVGLERNYVPEEENEHRMSYFLAEREDGSYYIEDLTVPVARMVVSGNNITYYFCTRSNRNGIVVDNVADLPKEIFNPENEILFVIHGWQSDYNGKINNYVKSAILETFDMNVVIVDWGSVSKRGYITAALKVPDLGNLVAEFIRSLTSTYELPLSQVSIVGHSLGAHLSGVVGSALEGKIDTIVGLDPAGPLISVSNTDYRIDPSDANYVQIIHTNGGFLGMMSSLGHSDYFPNGGKQQPGCGFDFAGTCSHSRSYEYYAESILKQFQAEECASYSDFSKGKCNGTFSYMGGYTVDKGASGDFYLDTNKKYPYAITETK